MLTVFLLCWSDFGRFLFARLSQKTQKPKKLEVILFLPAPFYWGGGTFLAAGGQLSKFPLKILATLLIFRRLYNCAVNNDLSSVWLS